MKNSLSPDSKNPLVDHLLIEQHLLEEITDILVEEKIRYKVRKMSHSLEISDMELFPQAKLNDGNYVIQVPKNMKTRVSDLVQIKLDGFDNSNEVRTLFLKSTLNEEGLINILLFPEEWEDRDLELAKVILKEKDIQLSKDEIIQQRKEKEPNPSFFSDSFKNGIAITFFIGFLIYLLYSYWYN